VLLLFLYLINLYIRPQDWAPLFYAWPVDYIIIIPALLAGLVMQSAENKKTVKNPQYGLLIALLLIIFASNAVHGNIVFGFDQFIKFSKKACIFIMILLFINSTKKLKTIMFFIVLLSSFIAYQAIAQFISGGVGFAGQDFYHSGEGLRTAWVGLWNGSNITALLLNVSIPFAIEFAFGPYPFYWRMFNIVLTACLIGGVYTTNSRGGFVTLLAILFIYPIVRLKKKKSAIIIGVFLSVALLLFMAPSRLGQFSTDEESAHIRTRLWGNAMDMFKENPILGIGGGRFIEENGRNMMAHSNFMQTLAEIGSIGIFIWVGLIYFSFKGLYWVYKLKTVPGTNEETFKSLARALLVSMLGFNICTLFITMNIDLFYLLIGLCAAAINIMNKEIKPIQMSFTFKDLIGISGSITVLLLFYHYYTR